MTDSVINTLTKTAGAVRDFPIDWTPYLQPGETITASTWSVSPAGLTIGAGAYIPTIDSDGKGTKVWLSGGNPGAGYIVTNHITTSNTPAREDDRSLQINVEGSPAVQVGTGIIDLVQFGADPTGVADATAKLQQALDAMEPGGVVWIPTGTYRINLGSPTTITIPAGVRIDGPDLGLSLGGRVFSPGIAQIGARLNVYGTGKLFTMEQVSRARNLEIYYPNQQTNAAPDVYDYTFSIGANAHWCSLENIVAINPYRFCEVRANGFTANNIGGWPLSRGVVLGRVADVARVTNVHLNPVTNFQNGATLTAWVLANGTAFSVDGAEEFQFTDCFAYGYGTGLRFQDEDLDGFRGVYGSWKGGGLDICNQCVYVAEPNGLTLRALRMSNVGLVPNGGAAVGVLFQDTHVPANPDERPTIIMNNVAMWNTMSRGIWVQGGSYGIVSLVNGTIRGHVNEAMRVTDATGTGHFDHVFAAATRTGGAGTIVDDNPLV